MTDRSPKRKSLPAGCRCPHCLDVKQIQTEAGDKAVFRDGKLFLDGREAAFFFFDQDYYWMLSDNANEAIDSRHLGFIPRDHIIGNAWLCWYSKERQRILKPVN